jgi:hypothetical protein
VCDLTLVFKDYSNHLKKIEGKKEGQQKIPQNGRKTPSTNCTLALGNFKFGGESTLNESSVKKGFSFGSTADAFAMKSQFSFGSGSTVTRLKKPPVIRKSQVLRSQQLQLRVRRVDIHWRIIWFFVRRLPAIFLRQCRFTEEGRGRSCWRCGEGRRGATEERICAGRRGKQNL